MNAARRKMIAKAIELLEEVRDEEQEPFDNLPESFQSSERGEQMGENVYNLDEAGDNLYDIISNLEEM